MRQQRTAERTVVLVSPRLTMRKLSTLKHVYEAYGRVLVESLEYMHARGLTSWTKAKKELYKHFREKYPELPSHYVHEAIRDASARLKSFLKLKKKGLAYTDKPVVKTWSVGCDNQMWKLSLQGVSIATHRGWVAVDLEPQRQLWRYINSGWRVANEAKVKLDRRERRLILYFTFKREVEVYKPDGFMSVDVNENSVAVLVDREVLLFETSMKKIVLGYYYRRKRVQERYDKLYGVYSRIKRKVLRKLKEKEKKNDARWKVANLIVREAVKHGYAIVLEKLGKRPADSMMVRIRDRQLRHRIYQASFRGVQRAIEEKGFSSGFSFIASSSFPRIGLGSSSPSGAFRVTPGTPHLAWSRGEPMRVLAPSSSYPPYN